MSAKLVFLVVVAVVSAEDSTDYSTEVPVISLSHFETLLDDIWRQKTTNGTTIAALQRLQWLWSRAFDSTFKTLYPLLSETLFQADLSPHCLRAILRFQDALKRQHEWPIRMLDSWARFPFAGLFSGTIADLGEFDACLAVRHSDGEFATRGQHCVLELALPMPRPPADLRYSAPVLNATNTSLENTFFETVAKNANFFYIARGLRLGVCVPHQCSRVDLQRLLRTIPFQSTLSLDVLYCQSRDSIDSKALTGGQWLAASVWTAMTAVVVMATVVNHFRPHPLTAGLSVIVCAQKLFRTSTQTPRLRAVHGLRVLSILWILLGHVYLMQFFQAFHVMRRSLEEMPRLIQYRYQALKLGSFLQVETFLMLGGVTAAFVTLEMTSRAKRPFDWFLFLFLRWLRYTPALCGLLLLYLLLPLASEGPVYAHYMRAICRPCEQYFYRNLFYFNNFYDWKGNCAAHTWYLAADFQLYALSPPLIFALKRRPLAASLLCLVLVLTGALLSIAPPLLDASLSPTMYSMDILLSEEHISRHFRLLYWGAWNHVSPYVIGLWLGWAVHARPTIRIPFAIRALLWTVCSVSSIGSVFWTTNWMNSNASEDTPSRAQRLLFTAFHRITWCALPFWIVLSSALGYNRGPVCRLFSALWWTPLSRLTYCLYLVQLIPILFNAYSVRDVTRFDDFSNWSVAALSTLIGCALAFALHALFESPFQALFSSTMRGKRYERNNEAIIAQTSA